MVLGDAVDDLENKKKFLPLAEIEKLCFGRPARSLVTLPATPAIPKLWPRHRRIFPNVVFFFQFMFIILSNDYYVVRTNNYEVIFIVAPCIF